MESVTLVATVEQRKLENCKLNLWVSDKVRLMYSTFVEHLLVTFFADSTHAELLRNPAMCRRLGRADDEVLYFNL